MESLGPCDCCGASAVVNLFYDGRHVGKRCDACFERLERRLRLGNLGIFDDVDDASDDDPLDEIRLTWMRGGYCGEA